LPPIQEALLANDKWLAFCEAAARNGNSKHNRKYSLPQRPGEKTSNMANSGSRRIFDDRASLAAARNVHRLSYRVQVLRS